jgi:hypothetical protein
VTATDELVRRRAARKKVEQLVIRLHRIMVRVGKACGDGKVSGHILRGGVPFRELRGKVKKGVVFKNSTPALEKWKMAVGLS